MRTYNPPTTHLNPDPKTPEPCVRTKLIYAQIMFVNKMYVKM